MPVLFFCFRTMFYGLRSQWIMLYFLKKSNPESICIENLNIKSSPTPQNLNYLKNSYRFWWRSSKTKQGCPLKKNACFNLIILLLSFGSLIKTCYSNLISTLACVQNLASFLMILIAQSYFFLWSNALNTWPNEPFPSMSNT